MTTAAATCPADVARGACPPARTPGAGRAGDGPRSGRRRERAVRRARPDPRQPPNSRSAGASPGPRGATSSGRSGTSGRWSRRSGRAARSICWRPRTCRCGPAPSRHCPDPRRSIPSRSRSARRGRRGDRGDRRGAAGRRAHGRRAHRRLGERTGPWAVERTMDAFQVKWPRWRQLTSTAAHRGVLCFGPNKGRNVTYTNPHRWLPGFRPAAAHPRPWRPSSAATSTRSGRRRRNTSRDGSASRHARRGRRSRTLGDELEAVEMDGERAWVVAGDTAVPSRPPAGSGSSPTSMPTWSPGSRAHACSRARRRSAR